MRKPLLIFGAGGHGKVVADAVCLSEEFELAGFVDDEPSRAGTQFFGSSVLGTRADLVRLREDGIEYAIPALGDNALRLSSIQILENAGMIPVVIVHPSAVVASSVQLKRGTFVAAGAVINPACVIGRACIVNTGATVDHDCRIANGVHIAPGVHLCGEVHVGERSLIGVGASVLPGVQIGNDCRIGGGAAVTENVAHSLTVVGVPARPVV